MPKSGKIQIKLDRIAASRALAALVGACLVLAAAARGQSTDAARADYQVYALRYAQAAEIEPTLLQVLGDQAEVIADHRANRILVRGNSQAQAVANQTIRSLDRPGPGSGPPKLVSYPYREQDFEAKVAQLKAQFPADTGVRIAADARTSQILVLAPPEVHRHLSSLLGRGQQPPSAESRPSPRREPPVRAAQAQPVEPRGPAAPQRQPQQRRQPSQNQPQQQRRQQQNLQPQLQPQGARRPPLRRPGEIHLAHQNWDAVYGRLKRIWGERLIEEARPQPGVHVFALQVKQQPPLRLIVRPQQGHIHLRGPAALAAAMDRVLRVLDQPPPQEGNRAELVALKNSDPRKVRYAVETYRNGTSGAKAAQPLPEKSATFLTKLFNQREQNQDQPADNQPQDQPPQPENGNQPNVQAQPGQGIKLEGGGLIGTVRIEQIEGLDAFVIRGNARDVERVLRIIDEIERLSIETEPVVQVHQLRHVGSQAMADLVRQLYDEILSPRQGRVSITALVKPNALLLIGRRDSVQTVQDLIRRLDQPVGPSTQFEVFRLKHASAASAQATIQEFFAERTALGTKVLVTADFRTNSLIIQASPRDMAEVSLMIKKLDTVDNQAINELRVFKLQNSLADDLAPLLQNAISAQQQAPTQQAAGPGIGAQAAGQAGASVQQQLALQGKSSVLRFLTIDSQGQQKLKSGILTDVRITPDPRANALVVSASSDSMPLIEALIKELDQIPAAQAQIKVFTIVNGDAQALTEMLEALFGGQVVGPQQTAGPQETGGLIQGETSILPLRFSVDPRTNSIIASGSTSDLRVVEAILLRLDESDIRQRQTEVFRLKNSPATDVSNAINEFLRSRREVEQVEPGLVSPFEQIEREVVVVPEPVSNSLIVSATPRFFSDIRALVERLDARPPMVMIQVLIAEVALNNTDEFGVELGLQDSILFDRSLLGDLVTTTTTTTLGNQQTIQDQIIQAASNTPGFAFNNQPLGNSGSDSSLATAGKVGTQALSHFSVGRLNGELGFGGLVLSASSESVSALIRALKESRKLKVLSRPQVMTLDNQPAFVQVGERVPRVTGTQTNEAGQTNTITLENVGLILGVTPRISPDDLIVMELDAERSAVGPLADGIPISIAPNGDAILSPRINTITAQTTVSALNGQTIVLGGLITEDQREVHREVPLLGQMPVIKHLFRYDSVQKERTELLIIMTPHVVRNEWDAERIKREESARMGWCLSDVERLHGAAGLRSRGDHWSDGEVRVIYPDLDPSGAEPIPAPPKVPQPPEAPQQPERQENGPELEMQTEPPEESTSSKRRPAVQPARQTRRDPSAVQSGSVRFREIEQMSYQERAAANGEATAYDPRSVPSRQRPPQVRYDYNPNAPLRR